MPTMCVSGPTADSNRRIMSVRGLLTVTSLSLVMCLAPIHQNFNSPAGKSGVVMGHCLWVRDLVYQRF